MRARMISSMVGAVALAFGLLVLVPASPASATTETFSYTLGDVVMDGQPAVGAGNIESPSSIDEYTFTGVAGQDLFFKAINEFTGGTLQWTLKTPSTATIFNTDFSSQDMVHLAASGTYTLTLHTGGSGQGTYGFRVNAIVTSTFPYTLGTVITDGLPGAGQGNLEDSGYRDTYTFAGVAGQHVFVLGLWNTFAGSLKWSLTGPADIVIVPLQYEFYTVGDIALPTTGTYKLTLTSSTSGKTGVYSFRINDVVYQTFPYTLGTVISDGVPGVGAGRLEDTGYRDNYTFEATAGTRIFLEAISDSSGNSVSLTLTDPAGGVVRRQGFVDTDDIYLPLTGTYTLTVSDPHPPSVYSLRISLIVNQTFSYALGTTVSDAVPAVGAGNLEDSGNRDSYTFAATAGQKLFFQALSDSMNGMQWMLTSPSGSWVFGQQLKGAIDAPFLPLTGTYTLTVFAWTYAGSGTYSFRIVPKVVSTFAYTVGSVVSNGVPAVGAGNLEQPGAVDVYAFNGTAGQHVTMSAITDNVGDGLVWTLTAPGASDIVGPTSFADNDVVLPSSGSYQLRVSSGLSGQTGTYSLRVGAPAAPAAPVIGTAAAGGGAGEADVSWTASSDNGSPITGYAVTPSIGAVAQPIHLFAGQTSTTQTITGLAVGTTYTFKVAAMNALGTGPQSDASNAVLILNAPGKPTGVTGVPGNTQATVSWVAPALTGGLPISSYQVTAAPGGATCTWSSGPLKCTITGLTNGTPYKFTVIATNAKGPGPTSAESASVYPARFSDVPFGAPFYADINWMVDQNVTTGYPNGNFLPAGAVSRQSMAAFLYRFKGKPLGDNPPCLVAPFKDVALGAPFCGEISWMVGAGITTGYADGGFHPTESVSRQSMAAFLYRFKNKPLGATPPCPVAPFNDVLLGAPFCGEISWMVGAGITTGYADGGFHPTASVSRQAMAALLHRLSLLP